MIVRYVGSKFAFAAASAFFGLTLVGATNAQAQTVRQQCSTKYQAAKAAGNLAGQTWNQFYSQCAAEVKVAPTGTPAQTAVPPAAAAPANPMKPAAPAAAAPAKPVATSPKPVATPSTTETPAPGNAVFPTAISPAHASEKPGRAREMTCLDQYNANKATNSNGGLKWIQKGGGYYSECNKKLKG
jgi:hypothetical protein